jgi:hypothetical protein
VAIATLEFFIKVIGMTEKSVIRKVNIFDNVTLGTTTRYGKRGFPFVTGTTGFSHLHTGHRDMSVRPASPKQFIMAIGTAIASTDMGIMREWESTEVGDGHGNIFDHMTAETFGKGKSPFFIVAGSARRSFFHFSHGNRLTFAEHMEDFIMTFSAIVFQFQQVDFVVKRHLTDRFSRELDDFVILGKQHQRNEAQHHKN